MVKISNCVVNDNGNILYTFTYVYIGYYCCCCCCHRCHCCCSNIALSLWLYHRFIGLIPYVAIRSSAHMYVCTRMNEFELIERNEMILYYTWLIHGEVLYVYLCVRNTQTRTHTHTPMNINAHIKWDTMILIHFHRHVSCARKRWTNERKCKWTNRRGAREREQEQKMPKWNVD